MKLLLQILYTIPSLIGCWLIIKKKRNGWFLWMIGIPFMFGYLILTKGYWMIPVFCVYFYLDIKGYIEWKK